MILLNTEGFSFIFWVIVHACIPSSTSLAIGLHAYFHLDKGLVHIATYSVQEWFVRHEETWLSDQYVKYVNDFAGISGAHALKLFVDIYSIWTFQTREISLGVGVFGKCRSVPLGSETELQLQLERKNDVHISLLFPAFIIPPHHLGTYDHLLW